MLNIMLYRLGLSWLDKYFDISGFSLSAFPTVSASVWIPWVFCHVCASYLSWWPCYTVSIHLPFWSSLSTGFQSSCQSSEKLASLHNKLLSDVHITYTQRCYVQNCISIMQIFHIYAVLPLSHIRHIIQVTAGCAASCKKRPRHL